MRVIGIDPGSQHLGWGIVETARGAPGSLRHVGSGTLSARGALAERLVQLADALEALLVTHRPEVAAMETVFHAKNARSALVLGQARGAILLCLCRAGLPVYEYAPTQIKQAATGRGGADKTQVAAMVRMLLRLPGLDQRLDTTDALAAALCHAQVGPSLAWREAR